MEPSVGQMPIVWEKKSVVSNLFTSSIGSNIILLNVTVAHFVNDKRLSHVPGPNVHNFSITDKTQAPYWSVAKNERFKARSVKHPGPGEYEYPKFTDSGPKYTQRVKPYIDQLYKEQFKMKTAPGPGLYSPEKPQTQI